jgi:hypothetical protein
MFCSLRGERKCTVVGVGVGVGADVGAGSGAGAVIWVFVATVACLYHTWTC